MKNIESKKGSLRVKIYRDADNLGAAAAIAVAEKLNAAVSEKGFANLLLATGTSQFQFLEHLQQHKIEWDKITVLHLDEYLGLPENHPASFRRYLKERILDNVQPRQIFFMNGNATDTDAEVVRYEKLFQKHPIDVACIGIGENGHIAFNDPPVADFNDPRLVKVVKLDESARKQQQGEGWFSSVEEVPVHALTLTIPAILSSKSISCVVPGKRKAEAVYKALNLEISTACPASILKTHSDTIVYLDEDSASKIK